MTRSHPATASRVSSPATARTRWSGATKTRRSPSALAGEESEIARGVVETPAGSAEDGQFPEAELVQSIAEGLVEVGPVLIRAMDHPLLADEGADPRGDGVEIADNGCGPQPNPTEVIGPAIRGEQHLGGSCQRGKLFGPTNGAVGDKDWARHQHPEDHSPE